jgi:bacillithiol biosynthesis deacetylase BshB1
MPISTNSNTGARRIRSWRFEIQQGGLVLDVIAFAAHPDDAEAACGGWLARLARTGHAVAICDLTRGELGTNGSVETRASEAAAAATVLGVTTRLQLGLPDGGLAEHDESQVAALVRVLRQHRPRLVIGPHEASRHPDHAATTALLRRAQFFCAVGRFLPSVEPAERPVLVRALDYHPMTPSFVTDVTDTLAIKLEALRCYRSQFERTPGTRATVLNDPAWLVRIETTARHYGTRIGRGAGEPYAVDGDVPLDDPLGQLAARREVRP